MEASDTQDGLVEHSRHTTMNNNNWQNIDASSFYRIITPPVVQEGKLGLPKKFVEEYSNKLSSNIRLSVPSGGVWHVGIERAENMIWLRDGWPRFSEHHSIKYGYFLLFKYKGNSEFDVSIFDLTATEIEYPCSIDTNKQFSYVARFTAPEHDKISGHTADQPIEISDSSETEAEIQDVTPESGRTCSHRKRSKNRGASEEEKRWEQRIATTLFKSDKPFFTTIMRPYNLGGAFLLHVPAEFSKTYLSVLQNFIQLQDSDNKKWNVSMVTRRGRVTSLTKGWSHFAKEKELCLGDVCVFELIQPDRVVLKVSTFRAKDRVKLS